MADKYRAVVGLRYPVGDQNIKRAQRGELDKVRKWREVEAGEVVDDVPACSVPWLTEAGLIEAVE